MLSILKRLIREPLFHFAFAGFLLFVFYDYKQGLQSEAPNRIVVMANQVEQLSARFKLTKLRPPSKVELDALVEDFVRDEVFYREALAMELDQNDAQIRKQMRIKLEYYLEELSTDTLSDELLRTYFKQHPEKFREDAYYSFLQLYINPQQHRDPEAIAKDVLRQLNDGENGETLGDRTVLQPFFPLTTSREIDNYFGSGFSDQLAQLNSNEWAGPIVSSYGLHLIKVTDQVAGQLPEFNFIRKNVEREYKAQQRMEQKDQAYEIMRKRYQVVIESAVADKTGAGEHASNANHQ